jgi:hypothetical protein
MGKHRHPALVAQFTVLEGALSIFLRFGGRDGIRTHDLLIANSGENKQGKAPQSLIYFRGALNWQVWQAGFLLTLFSAVRR